jgi:hypothetical protein
MRCHVVSVRTVISIRKGGIYNAKPATGGPLPKITEHQLVKLQTDDGEQHVLQHMQHDCDTRGQ